MKAFRLGWIILFALFLRSGLVMGQDNPVFLDSIDFLIDQAEIMQKSDPSQLKDPKKAALYSAVLPGLGQAYNKKYWKIPLIYGGFFALGYYIDWNNDNYNLYRSALFSIIDGNDDTVNPFPGFSESQLRQITDEFKRNRDMLVILTGVLYALNIIDAHVDAHLKEFDINEDLALSLKPANITAGAVTGTGLSLSLKIK